MSDLQVQLFKIQKMPGEESLLNINAEDEQEEGSAGLEQVIERVGGEGKYQKISFAIFCLLWFLTAWLLLGMNFFFDDSFSCKDPELADEELCKNHVCGLPNNQRASAIDWHAQSIIFSFEQYLICPDHQTAVSILQDMMFLGSLIGFFVIPFIADNFGRRLAMRIAWGIGTLSVLLTALSDSTNMLGIGLFLIGFGTNPAITLCFSFINEVCLGKSRQTYGVGVQAAWAIGETSIALIFLTGLSWKAILFIMLILFVLASIAIEIFLLETPMFLLKKHPAEALVVLNKMAARNGRSELKAEDIAHLECSEQEHGLLPEQKGLGFFDLFKFKSIRWTSISAAMIFFGIQAIYYSSTLNEGSVGFTKTINQIVFGISEMLGYLSAELVIHKCQRKKASFLGMGLSTGFCLVLGIMVMIENPDNQQIFMWLETIALMLSRFVLCGFWSIFFVYVAQLYPTEIRSLGFGWTSVAGMIGSILSPFVRSIASGFHINSWFPPALIGLVACFFACCLSETQGKPLKDTIDERLQVLIEEKSELQTQADENPIDDFEDIPIKPARSEIFIAHKKDSEPRIKYRNSSVSS